MHECSTSLCSTASCTCLACQERCKSSSTWVFLGGFAAAGAQLNERGRLPFPRFRNFGMSCGSMNPPDVSYMHGTAPPTITRRDSRPVSACRCAQLHGASPLALPYSTPGMPKPAQSTGPPRWKPCPPPRNPCLQPALTIALCTYTTRTDCHRAHLPTPLRPKRNQICATFVCRMSVQVLDVNTSVHSHNS